MTLTALRDDALRSADGGFVLRLGLPWIRSLPLASLADLTVAIDGEPAEGLTVQLDGRDIELVGTRRRGRLVVPAGPPRNPRRARARHPAPMTSR